MTETGTETYTAETGTNLTAEQIRNLTAEREYLEAKAALPSTDAWFRGLCRGADPLHRPGAPRSAVTAILDRAAVAARLGIKPQSVTRMPHAQQARHGYLPHLRALTWPPGSGQ